MKKILFLATFILIFLFGKAAAFAKVDKIDGVCGTTVNTCIAGEFKDKEDTDKDYKWECKGIDGGKDEDCKIKKEEQKVLLCHRDASHTKPYGPKAIEVDASSVISDGHDGHDGPVWFSGITVEWGDIIPPFGDYGGKNWTSEGQNFWNNDCQIPASPVDCVWHWSECSVQCGGGTQTVIVDTPPSNGGKECPTKSQRCNTQSCDEEPDCPTECGYEGGKLSWGDGQTKICPATETCSTSTPTPTPTPTPISCGQDEHIDLSGTKCLKWELGGAPVSSGTTTGQVLGASSMAGTGVAEETLFNLVFTFGSLLSAFGIRKYSSSKVK